jgi:hypothetical protein
MKALVAVGAHGGRHMLMVVPTDFDTQTWAESRREAFALLEIVRVVEEHHV